VAGVVVGLYVLGMGVTGRMIVFRNELEQRPAFTCSVIRLRSSSAMTPRTAKMAGVDVSICSLMPTKAIPSELKVSSTRSAQAEGDEPRRSYTCHRLDHHAEI
jgi:hypothetical protein